VDNMVVGTVDILTWCGLTTAARRNAIMEDLMPGPEGLQNLSDETEEALKDVCDGYNKRRNQPLIISRAAVKKLTALMYWVQDRTRLEEDPNFSDGTTRAEFLEQIKEAAERARLRQEQKKVGENLIGAEFTVQLKSRHQWERWLLELKTTLGAIIGAKGVPLTYVIRENDAPDLLGHQTWEAKAIAATTLRGREYVRDATTVHQIIIRNITEDSDAYTYVKPILKHENGRKDFKALINRYESQAGIQERISEAQKVLSQIRYRNERAMSFEAFSAKIQNALDELDTCGRGEHNGNVVDKLWDKIQNPELQTYIAALKVDYQRDQRSYKDILQDIASQIPTLTQKPPFRHNVSGVSTARNKFTDEGNAPSTGVYGSDGKMFVGSYSKEQWNSGSVTPFHDEIINARKEHGFYPKKRKSSYREKRKVKKLKSKLKKAKQQNRALSEVISSGATNSGSSDQRNVQKTTSSSNSSETNTNNQNAGLSFGGKRSMVNKKKKSTPSDSDSSS